MPAHYVSKQFGKNLRALRLRAGLEHQIALARLLGLKDASRISLWESGRLPSAPTCRILMAALHCSARELLEDVVTPYDDLLGKKEVSSPERLLLNDDERGDVLMVRQLDHAHKAALRNTVLPAFVVASTRRGRRRRRRESSKPHAGAQAAR